jgi:hypothetical protein
MESQGGVPGVCAPSRALRWLLAFGIACIACDPAAADGLRFRASADYTWDDNVNRATKDNKLRDRFASANASATLPLQLSQRFRLMLAGTVGGDTYHTYSGLTRGFAEFNGELQFRNSGRYTSPIWALFVKQGQDWYQSDLRDGYRTTAGLSVKKPVTDKIFLFGAASYIQRDGRSTVFDTKEWSVRGNLDYALAPRHTFYLGLEYREGDSVSSAQPSLALLDIAKATVQDDVFTNPQLIAYRFEARTGIVTFGYNFAVAPRQSLDISYRGAYSRPKEQPSSSLTTDTIYYLDNQITLSYLIRF